MSVINEYINIEKEYKINLDSNEIYLNINENILMKMKSCLTQIDLHRYPTNDMQEIKKLYASTQIQILKILLLVMDQMKLLIL